MSRNLTPEPVATGSAETRIGQLRWREYGGPREAAGERTLLFVHGLLTNSDVWGEVIQNLSQDFRCITLDIPLGSHTIPAREDAALTVAALAQAVNEAAEQLCPHGFTLIGSDTGGVVSQLAAVQEPAGLKRLVLFSCDTEKNFLPLPLRYLQYVAYIPGTMQALRAALYLGWVRRLPIAFGWLVKRELDAAEWNSIITPLKDAGVRRDLAKVLKGISTKYTVQSARDLERFEHPTLFLWADTTKLFPIENARRLAARMPDAHVVPVPESYAFSQLDQPEFVANALRKELVG